MGNFIPLDGEKKEQCEEIAKEFLVTFSAEYVLAYGVEFTKMKMKEIDEEAIGEAEIKKELMYRKDAKCTDPHKMGALTKKGAIVKNWKHRYFVVNPNFSVSYYETEEAYHKSAKPKGVIHLAGYKVAESADNAKIEHLKVLAKALGLDAESLPLPEKFPPHTLALSHERRRNYYIMATDEDEKKGWVEMFKTCCRKTKGFKNEDPVAQAAFKTAYRRACHESDWYTRLDPSGGTEEQVLSETLVEIINNRVLSSVYNDLTGNYIIRKKVRQQVMKVLDSMVLALVVPALKGLVTTTEELKAPMEKLFNEKKDAIVDVQKKITSKLADVMGAIFNAAVEDASDNMKKLYEGLKELTVRTSTEMRNECVVRLTERLVKDTKESQDVAAVMKKHYRTFDGIIHRTSAWDHWYKVYNMEKEAMGIIDKYKESFEIEGDYRHVYRSHDMLAEVADAAFYTFEQTLEERTKDSDILKDNNKASDMMNKVKDEVIPKYDHDSKATPHDISFELTSTHIVEYVSKKIDPLTKDIRKEAEGAIPEPLKQLISIQDRYEYYIEGCVKELIRRAIGMPEPQMNGNSESSEKSGKQNGVMKKEMPKKDNQQEMKENEKESESKKVEKNGQEDEGTQENEEQENGNTTEENGEEKEVETNEEEVKESEENKEEVKECEKNEENGETTENNNEEKQDEETLGENGSTEECDEETQNDVEENDDTSM